MPSLPSTVTPEEGPTTARNALGPEINTAPWTNNAPVRAPGQRPGWAHPSMRNCDQKLHSNVGENQTSRSNGTHLEDMVQKDQNGPQLAETWQTHPRKAVRLGAGQQPAAPLHSLVQAN